MRISLCVPTYNRAPQLRELLDSIARQTGHQSRIEIVISDNASTDDTPALVERYRATGMPIVYDRLPENRGFDRNIMNAVEKASGEYCWLCGSDDILEPDAFEKVEAALHRNPALAGLSIGSQGYSSDLSQTVFVNDHISTEFTTDTVLAGREQVIGSIGAWMGYISSLVVRRSLWLEAAHNSDVTPYLRGYIHLYLIARMLDERSSWLCVPDRLVGCRVGNESFKPKDEFARTRLDIVGYDIAFGDVLGRGSTAYHRAMSKVAGFYIRTHFLTAKMSRASSSYWRQAVPTSLYYYWRYPIFWTNVLPIAFIPRMAMIVVRAIFRKSLKPLVFGRYA